jgi:hypothetical protein
MNANRILVPQTFKPAGVDPEVKVKEKINEIIEILEKADQIFKECGPKEEVLNLWNAGIERLAAAIWMYERENEQGNPESGEPSASDPVK